MRFNLNAATQRFLEHRKQITFFLLQKSGSIGIGIRREQRRATRTERAVENDLDRPLSEAAFGRIENRGRLASSLALSTAS